MESSQTAVTLPAAPSCVAWSPSGDVLVAGDASGSLHFLAPDGQLLFSQVLFSASAASTTFVHLAFTRPPSILEAQPELVAVSGAGEVIRLQDIPLSALLAAAHAGDSALVTTLRGAIGVSRGHTVKEGGGQVPAACVLWSPNCTAVLLATDKPNSPSSLCGVSVWGCYSDPPAPQPLLVCPPSAHSGAPSPAATGINPDATGRFVFVCNGQEAICVLDFHQFPQSSSAGEGVQQLQCELVLGGLQAQQPKFHSAAPILRAQEDVIEDSSDTAALLLGQGAVLQHDVILAAVAQVQTPAPQGGLSAEQWALVTLRCTLTAVPSGGVQARMVAESWCLFPHNSAAEGGAAAAPSVALPGSSLGRLALLSRHAEQRAVLWNATLGDDSLQVAEVLRADGLFAALEWAEARGVPPAAVYLAHAEELSAALSQAAQEGTSQQEELARVKSIAKSLDHVQDSLGAVVQIALGAGCSHPPCTEKLMLYALRRCELAEKAAQDTEGAHDLGHARQAALDAQSRWHTFRNALPVSAGGDAHFTTEAWHTFRTGDLLDAMQRHMQNGELSILSVLFSRHGSAAAANACGECLPLLPADVPPAEVAPLLQGTLLPHMSADMRVQVARECVHRCLAWEDQQQDPSGALLWLGVALSPLCSASMGAAPESGALQSLTGLDDVDDLIAACSSSGVQQQQQQEAFLNSLALDLTLPTGHGALCTQVQPGLQRLGALLRTQIQLQTDYQLRLPLAVLACETPGDLAVMLLDQEASPTQLPKHVQSTLAPFCSKFSVDLSDLLQQYVADLCGSLAEGGEELEARVAAVVCSAQDSSSQIACGLVYLKALMPPFSQHARDTVSMLLQLRSAEVEAVATQFRFMQLHSLLAQYGVVRMNLTDTLHARLVVGHVAQQVTPTSIYDALCISSAYAALLDVDAVASHVVAVATALPQRRESAVAAGIDMQAIVTDIPQQSGSFALHDIVSSAQSCAGGQALRCCLLARGERCVAAVLAPIRAAAATAAWRSGKWQEYAQDEQPSPAHLQEYDFVGCLSAAVRGRLVPPAPDAAWQPAAQADDPQDDEQVGVPAGTICMLRMALADHGLGCALRSCSLQGTAHAARVALAVLEAKAQQLCEQVQVLTRDNLASASLQEQALDALASLNAALEGGVCGDAPLATTLWQLLCAHTAHCFISKMVQEHGLLDQAAGISRWGPVASVQQGSGQLLGRITKRPLGHALGAPPKKDTAAGAGLDAHSMLQQHGAQFSRLSALLRFGCVLGVQGAAAQACLAAAGQLAFSDAHTAEQQWKDFVALAQCVQMPVLEACALVLLDAAARRDVPAVKLWSGIVGTRHATHAAEAHDLPQLRSVPAALGTLAAVVPPTGANLRSIADAVRHVSLALADSARAPEVEGGQGVVLCSAAHCIHHLIKATEVGDYASLTASTAATVLSSAADDIFGADSEEEGDTQGGAGGAHVPESSTKGPRYAAPHLQLQEFSAVVAGKALAAPWSAGSAAVLSATAVAKLLQVLLPAPGAAAADAHPLAEFLSSHRAMLACIVLSGVASLPGAYGAVSCAGKLLQAELASSAVDSALVSALMLGLGQNAALPLLQEELQQDSTDFSRVRVAACVGVQAAAAWGNQRLRAAAEQLLTKAHWWQILSSASVTFSPQLLVPAGELDAQHTDGAAAGAMSLLPAVCQVSLFDVDTVRQFCNSFGLNEVEAYSIACQLLLTHEGTLDMSSTPGVGSSPVLQHWQAKLAAFVNLLPEDDAIQILHEALPCICGVDYARLAFVLSQLMQLCPDDLAVANSRAVLDVLQRFQASNAAGSQARRRSSLTPLLSRSGLVFAPACVPSSHGGSYDAWARRTAGTCLSLHGVLEDPWPLLHLQLNPDSIAQLLSLCVPLDLSPDEFYIRLARRMVLALLKQHAVQARRLQLLQCTNVLRSEAERVLLMQCASQSGQGGASVSSCVFAQRVPEWLLPAGVAKLQEHTVASGSAEELSEDWNDNGLPSSLTVADVLEVIDNVRNREAALEALEWAMGQTPTDRVQMYSQHTDLHDLLYGNSEDSSSEAVLSVRAVACMQDGSRAQLTLTVPANALQLALEEKRALYGHCVHTWGVVSCVGGASVSYAPKTAASSPSDAVDTAAASPLPLPQLFPADSSAMNGQGAPVFMNNAPLKPTVASPTTYGLYRSGGALNTAAAACDSMYLDSAAADPAALLLAAFEMYLQAEHASPTARPQQLQYLVHLYCSLRGLPQPADSALPDLLAYVLKGCLTYSGTAEETAVLTDASARTAGLSAVKLCYARAAAHIATAMQAASVQAAGSMQELVDDGGDLGDAHAAMQQCMHRILLHAKSDSLRAQLMLLGPTAYASLAQFLEKPSALLKTMLGSFAAAAAAVKWRQRTLGNGTALRLSSAQTAVACEYGPVHGTGHELFTIMHCIAALSNGVGLYNAKSSLVQRWLLLPLPLVAAPPSPPSAGSMQFAAKDTQDAAECMNILRLLYILDGSNGVPSPPSAPADLLSTRAAGGKVLLKLAYLADTGKVDYRARARSLRCLLHLLSESQIAVLYSKGLSAVGAYLRTCECLAAFKDLHIPMDAEALQSSDMTALVRGIWRDHSRGSGVHLWRLLIRLMLGQQVSDQLLWHTILLRVQQSGHVALLQGALMGLARSSTAMHQRLASPEMQELWRDAVMAPLRWLQQLAQHTATQAAAVFNGEAKAINSVLQQAVEAMAAVEQSAQLLQQATFLPAEAAVEFAVAAAGFHTALLPHAAAALSAFMDVPAAVQVLLPCVPREGVPRTLQRTAACSGLQQAVHEQLLAQLLQDEELLLSTVRYGQWKHVAASACRCWREEEVVAVCAALLRGRHLAAAACLVQHWCDQHGLPRALAQLEAPSGSDVELSDAVLEEAALQWEGQVAPWQATADAHEALLPQLQLLAVFAEHVVGTESTSQHAFWGSS